MQPLLIGWKNAHSKVDILANVDRLASVDSLDTGGGQWGKTKVLRNWPFDNSTEILDVKNPVTGWTWLDRNLGAVRASTA